MNKKQDKKFVDFIKDLKKAEIEKTGQISPPLKQTIKQLSKSIGINEQKLRKFYYQIRPITKRDYVIAICAGLGLGPLDTNNAIKIINKNFDSISEPDTEELTKEKVLFDLLDNAYYERRSVSIKEINGALQRSGFDCLDIPESKLNQSLTNDFEIVQSHVYMDDEIPLYNSIESEYDFYEDRFYGEMEIKKKNNGPHYLLRFHYKNSYELFAFDSDRTYNYFSRKAFNSLESTGEYAPYFSDLKNSVSSYVKRMKETLDDTKNYKERISANIVDNKLHIFMETFNYAYPEFNEYYLVEKIGDTYSFTVSNESLFMKLYRKEDIRKKKVVTCYDLDLLEKQIKEREDVTVLRYYKNRKKLRSFIEMKNRIDQYKKDLKDKKINIRDPEIIDSQDESFLCEVFKVEKEFDCAVDYSTEYWEYVPRKNKATIVLNNGDRLDISLDMLREAFVLGFNSIEEINSFLKKHNAFEEIFE